MCSWMWVRPRLALLGSHAMPGCAAHCWPAWPPCMPPPRRPMLWCPLMHVRLGCPHGICCNHPDPLILCRHGRGCKAHTRQRCAGGRRLESGDHHRSQRELHRLLCFELHCLLCVITIGPSVSFAACFALSLTACFAPRAAPTPGLNSTGAGSRVAVTIGPSVRACGQPPLLVMPLHAALQPAPAVGLSTSASLLHCAVLWLTRWTGNKLPLLPCRHVCCRTTSFGVRDCRLLCRGVKELRQICVPPPACSATVWIR